MGIVLRNISGSVFSSYIMRSAGVDLGGWLHVGHALESSLRQGEKRYKIMRSSDYVTFLEGMNGGGYWEKCGIARETNGKGDIIMRPSVGVTFGLMKEGENYREGCGFYTMSGWNSRRSGRVSAYLFPTDS